MDNFGGELNGRHRLIGSWPSGVEERTRQALDKLVDQRLRTTMMANLWTTLVNTLGFGVETALGGNRFFDGNR